MSVAIVAMASVFSMIIKGDLPGRFVWRDEQAVVFLTINPITRATSWWCPSRRSITGQAIEHGLFDHLTDGPAPLGQAFEAGFDAPARRPHDCRPRGTAPALARVPGVRSRTSPFAKADPDPDPAALDAAAETIRQTLRDMGHGVRPE